jgi:ATP-dependent Clp protease ATP-binding subunit ClpB
VNYGARSVMNEVNTLAIQILAESQIQGDIPKKCAAYLICMCIIPDKSHTNRWLARLFINDAGDIDMAKEDPLGKLPSAINATLN